MSAHLDMNFQYYSACWSCLSRVFSKVLSRSNWQTSNEWCAYLNLSCLISSNCFWSLKISLLLFFTSISELSIPIFVNFSSSRSSNFSLSDFSLALASSLEFFSRFDLSLTSSMSCNFSFCNASLVFISSKSLNFSEFKFSLILTSSFDFWSRSDLSRTFSSDTVLSSDLSWVISSSVSASLCLFSSFKVNSSLSRTSFLISENWEG